MSTRRCLLQKERTATTADGPLKVRELVAGGNDCRPTNLYLADDLLATVKDQQLLPDKKKASTIQVLSEINDILRGFDPGGLSVGKCFS